ncbi:DUF1642 domain-containing protein [Streptococcus uberis]|uniref:DUF1642 domain-containing protein n=1 Tax=Streptococcus uberis TaxID=1349 RepID=UPI003D76B13E
MKIEEAKEELVKNKKYVSGCFDDEHCKQSFNEGIDLAISLINKIESDQPKPVVPQFILDWVDDSREHSYEFDEWFYYSNQPLEVYKWLNKKNKRQKELNALALVTLIVNGPDAVTVQKEKLYTVEIPNPNWGGDSVTILSKNSKNRIVITRCVEDNWKNIDCVQLTEEEIRNDFEWAWQWAKEVTE